MRARVFVLTLCVAALSAKSYAGVLVVTSNADSGPGTLRSAIAEATSGDRIAFALPTGATVITLVSPLPVAASPLSVDADNETADVTITGGAWPVGRGLWFTIGPGKVLILDTGLAGGVIAAGLTQPVTARLSLSARGNMAVQQSSMVRPSACGKTVDCHRPALSCSRAGRSISAPTTNERAGFRAGGEPSCSAPVR